MWWAILYHWWDCSELMSLSEIMESFVSKLWESRLFSNCVHPIPQQYYSKCLYQQAQLVIIHATNNKYTTPHTHTPIRWRHSKVVVIDWIDTNAFDGLRWNTFPLLYCRTKIYTYNIQKVNMCCVKFTLTVDNQQGKCFHFPCQLKAFHPLFHKLSNIHPVLSLPSWTLLSLSCRLVSFHHS